MYNAVVRDVTERRRAEAALRAHGGGRCGARTRSWSSSPTSRSHDLQEPLRDGRQLHAAAGASATAASWTTRPSEYIRYAVDGAPSACRR